MLVVDCNYKSYSNNTVVFLLVTEDCLISEEIVPELRLLFWLISVTLLFRNVGLDVLIWKKNFKRYI